MIVRGSWRRLLLGGFVAVEGRGPAPLVPLPRLRAPGFLPPSLVGATVPIGLGALLFLATLYLQQVLGFGPLDTGLAYLAVAVPVVAASLVASWLVSRLGRRAVAAVGILRQAAGLALLAGVPPDGTFVNHVLPGFVLVGLGAPIAFVPATGAAMSALRGDAGPASGVSNSAPQVGNALALASLATLAATASESLLSKGEPGAGAHRGVPGCLLLAAAMTLVGALAALQLADGPSAGRSDGRESRSVPLG